MSQHANLPLYRLFSDLFLPFSLCAPDSFTFKKRETKDPGWIKNAFEKKEALGWLLASRREKASRKRARIHVDPRNWFPSCRTVFPVRGNALSLQRLTLAGDIEETWLARHTHARVSKICKSLDVWILDGS